MIYILILLVLLFALWAAHEKGQDAGYRRGNFAADKTPEIPLAGCQSAAEKATYQAEV